MLDHNHQNASVTRLLYSKQVGTEQSQENVSGSQQNLPHVVLVVAVITCHTLHLKPGLPVVLTYLPPTDVLTSWLTRKENGDAVNESHVFISSHGRHSLCPFVKLWREGTIRECGEHMPILTWSQSFLLTGLGCFLAGKIPS